MDPICHTLVGASLAQAGLKRKTALGAATLIIAANLPDADVCSYAAGPVFPLTFRRGWTHGALAMIVLPFVLAGSMLLWDRWIRRRRHPERAPADARWLLALAALSLLTHPFLDWLNTYGIRLLMPVSPHWFYGDVLFIADPWIWLVLGAGVFGSLWMEWARDGGRGRAGADNVARAGLVLTSIYVALMTVSAFAARGVVRRALPPAERGDRLLVSPDPVTPFRKSVVVDAGDHYLVGPFDWLARPVTDPAAYRVVVKDDTTWAARAAARDRVGAMFLSWARFPYFRTDSSRAGVRVRMLDARYAPSPGAGFGTLTVEVR